MSRTGSNVITVWMSADDKRVTDFGTSAVCTRSDIAHMPFGCGTLKDFARNSTTLWYAGIMPPAGAHISMRGTRGSTPVVILDIRGRKEAESRPRSWRDV